MKRAFALLYALVTGGTPMRAACTCNYADDYYGDRSCVVTDSRNRF